MNIGLIAPLSGTLDSFFPEIIQEWEREGHIVFPLAGTPSGVLDVEVQPTITRRPAPTNILAPGQIKRWADRHNLDIVLANTSTGAALARVRNLKVPVVYFCHGLHWNHGTSLQARIWQWIEKFLLRNTHAVLCMNSDDRKWFYSHFDRERVFYLDYGVGVPLNVYGATDLPRNDTLQLLWAGEFSERKRPELMVDVAAVLVDRGVAFQLEMLGVGTRHDEIKKSVSDRGLSDYVSLPGYQPLQEYIRHCHVLVHTANWEGLPRVLLEGRAMQRQSIAFNVKGVRDIPDAILIPEVDINAFADAVEKHGATIRAGEYTLPPVPSEMDSARVAQSISSYLTSIV